jgi:tetratricopeptide (TPR) repeat protein
MVCADFRRRLPVAGALLACLVLAAPAAAQSTGMVKGKVLDQQGQPVEDAKVAIEFIDGVNRKYEVKTNRKGEFIQIGLTPGNYRLTASKEGVGVQSFDARVRLGVATEVNFQLVPGGQAPLSKEEAQKLQAFKAVFDAGVTASNAGSHDEAIAKYTEALALRTDCYACQYNIGGSLLAKKDYEQAEVAFKKALEMKPDSAEPYNALANLYNAQKKFDLAAQMTEEATKRAAAAGLSDASAANPDQLFNQGVIFWNAGKIADAKKQFEQALVLKPDHAEAHYWVGMANLNEGKMPEAATHFEEYLKLAPEGQYATTAKGVLTQIKK